ncbi:HAD-IA family hydrolase [Shewanella marina]|uniref:HAD-IA family hydrolase n=1 Tax=Shewanella marina TaxID=487319 RepID=UPI000472048A|nr:HAD-IA family hydrolase [Shewanella marina]
MKQYELVIFDWDGTLMDSIGKIVIAMQRAAEHLNMPVPTEQQVRDIIGLSLDKAVQQLFPNISQQQIAELAQYYSHFYKASDDFASPLFDGVVELLQQLKQADIKLAVATGKSRRGLDRVLALTELADIFDTTRCADEACSKPAPEMILQILSQLNVAPEKALMVGDSIHDLNMANNAGVDGVGVTFGAHDRVTLAQASPLAIIDNSLSLLDIINGIA